MVLGQRNIHTIQLTYWTSFNASAFQDICFTKVKEGQINITGITQVTSLLYNYNSEVDSNDQLAFYTAGTTDSNNPPQEVNPAGILNMSSLISSLSDAVTGTSYKYASATIGGDGSITLGDKVSQNQ